jgi:hypothetical protein
VPLAGSIAARAALAPHAAVSMAHTENDVLLYRFLIRRVLARLRRIFFDDVG